MCALVSITMGVSGMHACGYKCPYMVLSPVMAYLYDLCLAVATPVALIFNVFMDVNVIVVYSVYDKRFNQFRLGSH